MSTDIDPDTILPPMTARAFREMLEEAMEESAIENNARLVAVIKHAMDGLKSKLVADIVSICEACRMNPDPGYDEPMRLAHEQTCRVLAQVIREGYGLPPIQAMH